MEQQGNMDARKASLAGVPARSALAAYNLLRLSTDARPGTLSL